MVFSPINFYIKIDNHFVGFCEMGRTQGFVPKTSRWADNVVGNRLTMTQFTRL